MPESPASSAATGLQAGGPEGVSDSVRVRIQSGWIRLQFLVLEVQVTDCINWYEVNMDMPHLDSSYDHPHLRGPESDMHGLGDISAYRHQVMQQIRLEIDPVIHFAAWDDQGMARIQRRIGEKRHDEIVIPNESGWQVTAHHLCKDRAGRHDQRIKMSAHGTVTTSTAGFCAVIITAFTPNASADDCVDGLRKRKFGTTADFTR